MAKKAALAIRRATRKIAKKTRKSAKLGSGARFKAIVKAAKASGARNPQAVAAAAGRKKYGSKKLTALARAGKKT
jgi:hypothetical protein